MCNSCGTVARRVTRKILRKSPSLQRFAWPRLLDSGRARLREPTTLLARSCTYRANLTDHDTSGAVVYLSSQPYRSRQVSGHRRANRLSECTLGSHCRRRRGESVPHITLLRWDVAERMHPRSRRIPLESHRERRHSFDLVNSLQARAPAHKATSSVPMLRRHHHLGFACHHRGGAQGGGG